MKFKEVEYTIPSHGLSAIVNGDESSFDYYDDPADYQAYQQFCAEEIKDGTVCVNDEEGSFYRHHDATPYGVLACDCHNCTILYPVA